MIFYEEPGATVYCGHVLKELAGLPDKSVDCVMTSPPYWGLRTYKTEPQIWGDNHCEHEWVTETFSQHAGRGDCQSSKKYSAQEPVPDMVLKRDFCLKCNAWRGELGLEPTIKLYIEHLTLIFDEVKRVLKKTGTCWVNLDDSYAGSRRGGNDYGGMGKLTSKDLPHQRDSSMVAKSLCLIPFRFALAMADHGWILRNDIVWNKPNPMPESVKDRFTGSWEHLFFFVKSQRYFFEQQFEPILASSLEREKYGWNGTFRGRYDVPWENRAECKDQSYTNPQGRNKRDVWEITTQSYPGAHFATFPEKLCEAPILAGCPLAICKKCGKAREKIYRQAEYQKHDTETFDLETHGQGANRSKHSPPIAVEDLGYTDCGCNAGFEPGILLDPFCGSGKALAVAKKLGRKSIGIDLSPDYCAMTVKQLQAIPIPMKLE